MPLAVSWPRPSDGVISMKTLKNPLHLFRTDGKSITLPLFKATWLPRGPHVIRQLNEALAARHLNSHCTKTETRPYRMSLSFYKPQFFDFRVEDELMPDLRYKAIFVDQTQMLAVTRTQTSKRFRSLTDKLLVKATQPGTDLIFALNAGCYFASYEEIAREVLVALNYFGSLKKSNEFEYVRAPAAPPSIADPQWHKFIGYSPLQLLSYLLVVSCKDSKALATTIQLIQSQLKEKSSDLAVLLRQLLADQQSITNYEFYKVRRRIALKAWARNNDIFSTCYRFLSKVKPAIIAERDALPELGKAMELCQEYLHKTAKQA